jgi:hypothetical protein
MAEPHVVEYIVDSKHLTSKIVHELLFSISKKQFIKPALSDKRDGGRLVYKLLPGNYIKFRLFALKKSDYAKFKIALVHIDQSGIDVKDIYEIELPFSVIKGVTDDPNAPYALAEFIRMTPHYHGVANVDINENYEMAEDIMQIIESIRKYFERKMVSQ